MGLRILRGNEVKFAKGCRPGVPAAVLYKDRLIPTKMVSKLTSWTGWHTAPSTYMSNRRVRACFLYGIAVLKIFVPRLCRHLSTISLGRRICMWWGGGGRSMFNISVYLGLVFSNNMIKDLFSPQMMTSEVILNTLSVVWYVCGRKSFTTIRWAHFNHVRFRAVLLWSRSI